MRHLVSTLPNRLSLFRILLSPVFFFFIISDNYVLRQLSILIYLVAAITDWYDGDIARKSGTETRTGKFLDPLADKFLTSAAFLAFAYLAYIPWWMVLIVVIRDVFITVLRSLAVNKDMHIVTSKTAQLKTFTQMAVLYYFLILIVSKDIGWVKDRFANQIQTMLEPTLIYIIMLVVTLFTLFTGIQYLIDNRAMLSKLFTFRDRQFE